MHAVAPSRLLKSVAKLASPLFPFDYMHCPFMYGLEGRKEMYPSLPANKAEWMEKRLSISGPTLYQGKL